MTKTDEIIRRIEASAPLRPDQIAAIEAEEFLKSERRGWMLAGERYYQNKNDILYRRRWVIGEDGRPHEDPTLTNRRIAHSFLRRLTDQKCQYLFGRPFTIRAENPEFQRLLEKNFDRRLRNRMKNLCKEAVTKGIGWLMACPGEEGLSFLKIPAEQVAPIWADSEHTQLDGVVRVYERQSNTAGRREEALCAEYWHKDGVEGLIFQNGKFVPDPERPPRAHLTVDGLPCNFERVPFIPFKYNEEEAPLIRFVKPLIDDYDLLRSEDADNLLDSPNSVMVLTNYDGEDLGEFRRNLARYKAVKVTDNGGLDVKSSPLSTDAVNAHLDRTRRDLYEAGRGVDTQRESLGNLSGVALKFLYADLDLDCSGIESEFAAGFEEMLFFLKSYFAVTGQGDFWREEAALILNRDILINEAEAVESCVQSEGILSKQTILENHPWVESAAMERRRIQEEQGRNV